MHNLYKYCFKQSKINYFDLREIDYQCINLHNICIMCTTNFSINNSITVDSRLGGRIHMISVVIISNYSLDNAVIFSYRFCSLANNDTVNK